MILLVMLMLSTDVSSRPVPTHARAVQYDHHQRLRQAIRKEDWAEVRSLTEWAWGTRQDGLPIRPMWVVSNPDGSHSVRTQSYRLSRPISAEYISGHGETM